MKRSKELKMIWTEWDNLKEVIVGDVYDPNYFSNYASSQIENSDNEFIDGMCKIFEETKEDLNSLQKILESYGVKVFRPKKLKINKEQTRMWSSQFPYPAICPRDMHIVYGNNIISKLVVMQIDIMKLISFHKSCLKNIKKDETILVCHVHY